MLEVGELRREVMETPGHSPGHVCFHIASEKVLVAGDRVFRGGIGRMDFPGCSEEDMRKSLERVKVMDRETVVFSDGRIFGARGRDHRRRRGRHQPFLEMNGGPEITRKEK